MVSIGLGIVEAKFAEIVWQNAPMTTRGLIDLCARELEWKRTTTYTVLRKMCERGLFQMQDSMVMVLVDKETFCAQKSEEFVDNYYGGSLPAFLAGVFSRRKPTPQELTEMKDLLQKQEQMQGSIG